MKKLLIAVLLAVLVVSVPLAALANSNQVSPHKLTERGWTCILIEGEPHCFDPGDNKSSNASTINVMVFDEDHKFQGTELLWLMHRYHGQPCPQDQLLNLGFTMACHHYSH